MRNTTLQGLILAIAALPSLAAAQNASRPVATPAVPDAVEGASVRTVTFVLVPTLEVDTAGAIVLRRATRGPQNVILVSPRTTPADVVTALSMLNRSRRSKGDSLALDMKAIVQRGSEAAARRSRNYEQAELSLQRLRMAHPRAIAGVGRYPAVTLTLSPARASRE